MIVYVLLVSCICIGGINQDFFLKKNNIVFKNYSEIQ